MVNEFDEQENIGFIPPETRTKTFTRHWDSIISVLEDPQGRDQLRIPGIYRGFRRYFGVSEITQEQHDDLVELAVNDCEEWLGPDDGISFADEDTCQEVRVIQLCKFLHYEVLPPERRFVQYPEFQPEFKKLGLRVLFSAGTVGAVGDGKGNSYSYVGERSLDMLRLLGIPYEMPEE